MTRCRACNRNFLAYVWGVCPSTDDGEHIIEETPEESR